MRFWIGVAFALALVTPSFPQQFSDVVPANHWAYGAVLRLKDSGLLVGYPAEDMFRGSRNATRYEMAAAIGAAQRYFKSIINHHELIIRELEKIEPYLLQRRAMWADLRLEIAKLRTDVEKIRAWRSELSDLTRLSLAFERELTALGGDLTEMRGDIADLQRRVRVLEGKG